jgi:hypothetical protein
MADANYVGYGAPPSAVGSGQAGRTQKIINIAGAAGSVALIVAMGWWGYDLAMRDLRGVPVVRALEGPMRIAPDDPGGEVVDHQGLSVNDVAAEGGAAPPADRLILAPKPVELTLEDSAGLAAPPAAPETAMQPARLDTPSAVTPVAGGTDAAVEAALAEALGIDEATPEETVEVAALDAAGLPPPEGAVTRSPRPLPRPDRAMQPVAAATPVKPEVVDPATLAPGTRLVQFGAYDSEAEAEAEWMRLAGRFGDLMAGKAMVIQTAESGGRTFYRLRAHGFEGEDDARRFCSALVTEGAGCIPVAHR